MKTAVCAHLSRHKLTDLASVVVNSIRGCSKQLNA